jgi:hypothetical protein
MLYMILLCAELSDAADKEHCQVYGPHKTVQKRVLTDSDHLSEGFFSNFFVFEHPNAAKRKCYLSYSTSARS